MKRELWILLHEENEKKICYDYSSGKYLLFFEQRKTGRTNLWPLFQPFFIVALETGQRLLADYPLNIRRAGGIVLLAAGGFLCSVIWETYLSNYFKTLRESTIELDRPRLDMRKQWAQESVGRLKTIRKMELFCRIPFAVFLLAFLYTGVPIALTLAYTCFVIGYILDASARPGLLRKYIHNYKEL